MEINIGEADDYIWILKVRYNAAMRRVRAFENGHAYQLLLEKDEAKEWRNKYYDLAYKIEKLQGENEKLKAQVNKDFENSSIPSSQQGAHCNKLARKFFVDLFRFIRLRYHKIRHTPFGVMLVWLILLYQRPVLFCCQ